MLHKKVSLSVQVNRLSLPARLLFTWMIPHADDEGRLKGDPEYIKATVVPMTKWSFTLIKKYLLEIENQRLISYWEEDGERVIEFIKWDNHQQIRKDRFEKSSLPSFNKEDDNQLDTNDQPSDNYLLPESNKVKSKIEEENKSELSVFGIGFDKTSKGSERIKIDPALFSPMNDKEQAALETWRRVEPNRPESFGFYLWAINQKIPLTKFYEFSSEIIQDPSIKNKGAVFNRKVISYLKRMSV